ncbi:YaaA family protein [Sulfurimonas sp. HSL-1716]|uniref:YaaA family protein n=1 Tax=Hydrocurvibacter sulfurireducens TaxID=3131937 RepID=UPI0031F92051
MLAILFSPSENKNRGGDERRKELFCSDKARTEILNSYNEIILRQNEEELKELFGIKNPKEFEQYLKGLDTDSLMYAVQRYSGVAYDYLDYGSLETDAKEYLKKNVIIFSNLYGPILGGDTIANYKVKQGNDIGSIAPDRFYKDRFSYQLDLYLADKEILDLRAGYYDKFYKPNKPFTTLKFLKEGKVLSHWAKAYRGMVLREAAKHNVISLEEFNKLNIEGLHVRDIKTLKNQTEITYDIV